MGKDWKGDIVFSDNVAIFRGHVGHNRAHSHWASQITIALDGEVEFETASGLQSSEAVYFSSKTEHRIFSGFICSIYYDPLSDSFLKTFNKDAPGGWKSLSHAELTQKLGPISASTNLRTLLNSELLRPLDITSSSDDRLHGVIQEIKAQHRDGRDIGRDSLAQIANLSPTRFSHWFVERTGIPLRSYKKWLKLRVAMDALLEGESPIDAALLAGFSDQAHMSRAFSDSFGLTYLDAQRAWEQFNKK
ncbi:MAG: helix-turn-helix transcriptional regulator [Spirochaetes bacterium]|nr:helix-turn-helix transcriptional regulator [Spirochaetota bacterium]